MIFLTIIIITNNNNHNNSHTQNAIIATIIITTQHLLSMFSKTWNFIPQKRNRFTFSQKSTWSRIINHFFSQEIPAGVQTAELVKQASVIPSRAKANLYPPPPDACFLTDFFPNVDQHTRLLLISAASLVSLRHETLFEPIRRPT